jgi:beta-phosphoglucomutase-like phosphatase (HAD superfamily)
MALSNVEGRRCLPAGGGQALAPAGVAAARAAGCAVIALTGTAPRSKLAETDLTVDSLRELNPEIIRGLLRQA